MGLSFPVGAKQLFLKAVTPAAGLLVIFVLRPGDGGRIKVFLRIGGNQFDGDVLRFLIFYFHRPGFGDFEIFQISSPPISGIVSLLLAGMSPNQLAEKLRFEILLSELRVMLHNRENDCSI